MTEIELVSALSRKVREAALSASDANKILVQFQSHLQRQLFLHLSVQSSHFQLARSWLAQFDTPLRSIDALHLALAKEQELELLTSDVHLAEAASHLDVPVKLINKHMQR